VKDSDRISCVCICDVSLCHLLMSKEVAVCSLSAHMLTMPINLHGVGCMCRLH
jgi:hypothetical protein